MARKNKKIIIISSLIIIILSAFIYGIKKAGENGKSRQNVQKENLGGQTNSEKEIQPDNNLINWKVPENEIIIDSLNADTNPDGKNETIVITEQPGKKKAYFYIFDSQGKNIYKRESGLSPDRIELRKFEGDNFDSFFLVFENQFENGLFIRWDGKQYLIPDGEKY